MSDFLNDIKGVRKRARSRMSESAVTDGYKADRGRACSTKSLP